MVKLKSIRGVSLIEVIVAIALFVIIAPSIVVMVLGGVQNVAKSEERLAALMLAQGGLEAARSIRDHDWNDLTVGIHGLSSSNGYWELQSTPETIGVYTRQITISDSSANQKELISQVSWGSSGFVTLNTRLSDWENAAPAGWSQTTDSDFLAGTLFNDVIVTNLSGGELQLASGEDDGEFESAPFDTGSSDPTYGNLNWTVTGPIGELEFQIKTSNVEAGLHSAKWLGPDGTDDTEYTTSGTPIVTTGGTRWVQYKFEMEESGSGASPILEDVTVEYAP